MLGDFLYKLSAKDVQSLGLDIFSYYQTISAAASSHYLTADVPPDRVLLLHRVTVDANPQASGDTIVNTRVYTGKFASHTALTTNPRLIGADQNGTNLNLAGWTGAVFSDFEFDSMPVPAGNGVCARVNFSGALGAHDVTVHIFGMSIPRGNIAI